MRAKIEFLVYLDGNVLAEVCYDSDVHRSFKLKRR